MSFIIPRAGRNTAFWSSRTPAEVGPGTYAQVSPPTSRCISVPFSVGSERPLSTLEGQDRAQGPGPGSYDLSTRQGRHWGGTSAFRNKVLRPEMPVGVISSSDVVTSPGPGAYETPGFREKVSFRRDYRRQKNSFLAVSLNPPSIPKPIFSIGETREAGPGSYDASEALTRTKGQALDFAASKVERRLWAGQDTPGPGHYSYRPRPRQTAAGVIGKDTRRGKETADSSSPGPGSYEPTLPGPISFSQKATFADTAGRKPLWSDRPVPGVGTYNLSAAPLGPTQRHQFLQETGSNLRPAFLSAGERDCLRSGQSRSPGPGAYEAASSLQMHNYSAHVESGKVKFMTTQARFKGLFEPKSGPDPGQYDPKSEGKAGETLSNNESRFKSYAKDNMHISVVTGGQDTPAVGSYSLADPWSAAKTRRFKGPNRSFDSSSLRFDPKESFPGERLRDIPGPGYYRRAVSGYRVEAEGKSMGKAKRFAGYGDYRGEDRVGEDLGPGSYHQDQSLLRKSFNATTRSKDW